MRTQKNLLSLGLVLILMMACGETSFKSSGNAPSKEDIAIEPGAGAGDQESLGKKQESEDSAGSGAENFKIGETQTAGAIDILLLLDTSSSMSNNITKVKAGIPSLWTSLPDADLRLGVRTINTTNQQSRKNINATTEQEFTQLISSEDFGDSGYKYNTLNFNDVKVGNELFSANAIVNPKNTEAMDKVNAAIDGYIRSSKNNIGIVNENGLCAALLGYQSVDVIKGVSKESSLFRQGANALVAIVVSDEDAQTLVDCDSDIKMNVGSMSKEYYSCSKKVTESVPTCLKYETKTCPGKCTKYTQVAYDCSVTDDGGNTIANTCYRNGTCEVMGDPYTCNSNICADTSQNYVNKTRTVSKSFDTMSQALAYQINGVKQYVANDCRLIASSQGAKSFTYRKTANLAQTNDASENVLAYKAAADKFKQKYTPHRDFIVSAISYTGKDTCISNDKNKSQADNYLTMAEKTHGVVTCIDDEDYGSVMKKISASINETVLTYSIRDASKVKTVTVDGLILEKDKAYHLDLEKNQITLNADKVKVGQTVQIYYDDDD